MNMTMTDYRAKLRTDNGILGVGILALAAVQVLAWLEIITPAAADHRFASFWNGFIAGAAFGSARVPELRCRLAAEILNRFMGCYACLGSRACYEAYKSRSVVLGKDVQLLSPGREAISARVLDIDEDFALVVRTADGQVQRVNAGEISLRPAEK